MTAAVLYAAGWHNVAPPDRIAGMLHSESHSQLIDDEETERLAAAGADAGGRRCAGSAPGRSSPDKFEVLEMQPAVLSVGAC